MKVIIEYQDQHGYWKRYTISNHQPSSYRSASNRDHQTGKRHRLIDEDGNIYVLFAYEVDSADFDRSFFEKIDVLSNYPHPKGWLYLSRILNEDLILNPNGIASVIAIQSETSSVWEKR